MATAKQAGVKHGWRSGLEERVAEQLDKLGVEYTYEKLKLKYIRPASEHIYTPDFHILANGIIVETKGRFLLADRMKHIMVKKHNPDVDIRFVFSNSNARISKASKTTYAMWCRKHGFLYADKTIPEEWINERRDD
jgi:Phage endonuclease I